ncbi:MAG: hypothetical protein RL211_1032 [Pseudomonadota bacterium]|jgi:hypothetical protein
MKYQLAIAFIAAAILVACGKKEEGASSGAAAPASPADMTDSKTKDDLARIRELMEKEEARKQAQAKRDRELADNHIKGSKAPLQTFGR